MSEKVNNSGYGVWLISDQGHIVVIDGDKCKFKQRDFRKGGSGFGMSEENVSYTISVRDRHMVGVFR